MSTGLRRDPNSENNSLLLPALPSLAAQSLQQQQQPSVRPGAAATTARGKRLMGAQGCCPLPSSPPHPGVTSSTVLQSLNWLLSPFPSALFSTHSSPSRETLFCCPWQLGATICLPHSMRIPSLSPLPTREKSQRNPESGQDRDSQRTQHPRACLQGHLGQGRGGGMETQKGMVRQRPRGGGPL